ncbi:LysR substrate-binding domain-containing protein [Paralimibaculum aggregatum]|uniref:LysR substrate-binding domain-containing protein n=1 Tax=Paralimibaculum aggregatum TaxID=3036245 RepID=A0ABQ6LN35_9RHOB|nr:LysR substrate-binding domain-containing protein [Limibaculum sp. NKW23]GMG81846.1 LysR substrate-binding domain-containing protein [Limibaculum sp. NKW23]
MLRKLPLETFRVFEAAARHGNFSAAARELGVTQAAVSRRIQALEAVLGRPLFTRRGRHIALTADGSDLHRRTTGALDYLAEALEPFAPMRHGAPVSVVAAGSVSHLWLGAEIRAFARDHPEAAVRLVTSDALRDLADDRHDLTVLYTRGAHPRWHLVELFPERLVPVASPGYLAARGLTPPLAPAEIAALDLVDYERFNAHWVSLADWAEAQGLAPQRARVTFSSYWLAVEAALEGDGVALGSLGLMARHLAAGRLVALGPEPLETGYGYWLGLPRGRTVSPEAMALYHRLAEAAAPG